MADSIPNDIFSEIMTGNLKNKRDSIVEFKQALKDKYPEHFQDDVNDDYIHLEFSMPSFNSSVGQDELKFGYTFNDKLDSRVKKEFEDFALAIQKILQP